MDVVAEIDEPPHLLAQPLGGPDGPQSDPESEALILSAGHRGQLERQFGDHRAQGRRVQAAARRFDGKRQFQAIAMLLSTAVVDGDTALVSIVPADDAILRAHQPHLVHGAGRRGGTSFITAHPGVAVPGAPPSPFRRPGWPETVCTSGAANTCWAVDWRCRRVGQQKI